MLTEDLGFKGDFLGLMEKIFRSWNGRVVKASDLN